MTRRVVLLCGPPGAGKTTWARESGLKVYDRDDPQWSGEKAFTTASARLAYDPDAQVVVIRSGATRSARSKTKRLINATEVRIIDLPADECKRRVRSRARSHPPMPVQLAAIDQWWTTYEREPAKTWTL